MLAGTALANPIGFANLPQSFATTITIGRDGSITPQTDLISRNGTTYTLTANVTGTLIIVECSDIVFDGDGYIIEGTALWVGYGPPGAGNVTIKNVEAKSAEIKLLCCSYSQIINVKTNHYLAVSMSDHTNISQCIGPIKIGSGSEHTRVSQNNITLLGVEGGSNVFYRNNFLRLNYTPLIYGDCSWGTNSVGNYWVDYNGTDADGAGIGDNPYTIDENNVDHYPLMFPVDIEDDAVDLPSQEPPAAASDFVISAAVGVSVVFVVAVVATGLLITATTEKCRLSKREM
jgi:hypothetical protein